MFYHLLCKVSLNISFYVDIYKLTDIAWKSCNNRININFMLIFTHFDIKIMTVKILNTKTFLTYRRLLIIINKFLINTKLKKEIIY